MLLLQVHNSPFNQEQSELLNRLLPTLSANQQIWLQGYLSALVVAKSAGFTDDATLSQTAATLLTAEPRPNVYEESALASAISTPVAVTILYGSQTGNCHRLADKFGTMLEQTGCDVKVSPMNQFKPNTLKKLSHLLIIVSTHGEGDPPDNALPFYEFLHSKRAPQLGELKYAVLSLGDSSYEFFCQTGKDFDKRLSELGAEPLTERVDCDLDFEESAAAWLNSVQVSLHPTSATSVATTSTAPSVISQTTTSAYSRSHPFKAEVLENLNLNGRGSERVTQHIELSLEGAGLVYEPGDSLGIYAENHPLLVAELIAALGWTSDTQVPVNKQGETRTLQEALSAYYEITVLTKPLLEQAAQLSNHPQLLELVADSQRLRGYMQGRDLLDLVQDFGAWGDDASTFVQTLRKLPPRLYSIASSPLATTDEVHVTIRRVAYEAHGRERYGVCSTHCSDRLEIGSHLPVFIQHNPGFKLPTNADTPIIMVGPGTGVAPFRAFVAEREESGATGKNWLFYGDRHFVTDFLYQTEWQRWKQDGVLTRLDVAFSRDTAEKVYVQHRIVEQGAEVYRWLEEGAHLYVCGDEKHMAHDVHAALLTVIAREGGKSEEEAVAYLQQLQQDNRYQRDVY